MRSCKCSSRSVCSVEQTWSDGLCTQCQQWCDDQSAASYTAYYLLRGQLSTRGQKFERDYAAQARNHSTCITPYTSTLTSESNAVRLQAGINQICWALTPSSCARLYAACHKGSPQLFPIVLVYAVRYYGTLVAFVAIVRSRQRVRFYFCLTRGQQWLFKIGGRAAWKL